ncbi:Hypothetical predicted protein [Olea europaea subsp. europaea]|uniref:Uncharacterized protein n=1 Tax=Olea europaea subsp. europaea TaxID=158383 RepID=A0A8S0T742_OLEEU|nr:Hypothetical predicted protein [Olea europaea subsp. europaea]
MVFVLLRFVVVVSVVAFCGGGVGDWWRRRRAGLSEVAPSPFVSPPFPLPQYRHYSTSIGCAVVRVVIAVVAVVVSVVAFCGGGVGDWVSNSVGMCLCGGGVLD